MEELFHLLIQANIDSSIELNAVQRANPEMQKRVYNAIRALSESIIIRLFQFMTMEQVVILTVFRNLLKQQVVKLISANYRLVILLFRPREIIGNESQERMGLVMKKVRC